MRHALPTTLVAGKPEGIGENVRSEGLTFGASCPISLGEMPRVLAQGRVSLYAVMLLCVTVWGLGPRHAAAHVAYDSHDAWHASRAVAWRDGATSSWGMAGATGLASRHTSRSSNLRLLLTVRTHNLVPESSWSRPAAEAASSEAALGSAERGHNPSDDAPGEEPGSDMRSVDSADNGAGFDDVDFQWRPCVRGCASLGREVEPGASHHRRALSRLEDNRADKPPRCLER